MANVENNVIITDGRIFKLLLIYINFLISTFTSAVFQSGLAINIVTDVNFVPTLQKLLTGSCTAGADTRSDVVSVGLEGWTITPVRILFALESSQIWKKKNSN